MEWKERGRQDEVVKNPSAVIDERPVRDDTWGNVQRWNGMTWRE